MVISGLVNIFPPKVFDCGLGMFLRKVDWSIYAIWLERKVACWRTLMVFDYDPVVLFPWCITASWFTIWVILQTITVWLGLLLTESGWSHVEGLLTTFFGMRLSIGSCVSPDYHCVGGYGWWWLPTSIEDRPRCLFYNRCFYRLLRHRIPLHFRLIYLKLTPFPICVDHWRSSGSGSASNTSWPSFAPSEMIGCLHNYAESLDTRPFQVISARGETCTVYNVRPGASRDTRAGG